MSKKRKTRKQKEQAKLHTPSLPTIDVKEPVYSITNIKTKEKVVDRPLQTSVPELTAEQKDIAYLKHDITSITSGSAFILAFDILLFIILTTGIFNLRFLGY